MKKSLFLLFILVGCVKDDINIQDAKIMFDDFDYLNSSDPLLASFGWEVRAGKGGPGESGATWKKENVTFLKDEDLSVNTFMKLTSSTNGNGKNTFQSEVNHKRNYLEGTYAARIYFTDSPTAGGIDGDQITQTFFAISPLAYALDTNYSELDFAEYLPNGGWGEDGNTFWMTSWETYQESPWIQDSKSDIVKGSFAGWHIISATVANGQVKYYIDGKLKAMHAGKYYPEQKMSISFNLWFINGGLLDNATSRTYEQMVDWVYFSEDPKLNHSKWNDRIQGLRNKKVVRIDEIE